MKLEVYTKYGKALKSFVNVDEIKYFGNYYEITFTNDEPHARIYGVKDVILIKTYSGL